MISLKQKSFKVRHVAIVSFVLLLISLIPLLYIATFNHASYDDLGFSINTHKEWITNSNAISTVKAAIENTRSIRGTWEGTYSTSFISALQPALFGEQYYFIGTWILLGGFLLAMWSFVNSLVKRTGVAGSPVALLLFSLITLITIQFTPDPSEAFFWFNGGVAYTFLWSVALYRLSLAIKLTMKTKKTIWIARMVLYFVLSICVGGAKYSTILFFLLIDVLVLVCSIAHKTKSKMPLFIGCLLLAGGFVFSAIAPGNSVRALTMPPPMNIIKAIVQALFFGATLMAKWFSFAVLAVMCVGVLVGYGVGNIFQLKGRTIILMGLGCYLLFSAQLSPTIYTGNYLGDGRVLNTYYYSYILMLAFYAVSLGMWVKSTAEGKEVKVVSCATICVISTLFALSVIGYQPDGAQSYGPQHTTSGSAFRAIVNGQAQRYDELMTERENKLRDPMQKIVYVQPIEDIPTIFMGDALLAPNIDYVLSLYKTYYSKDAVLLEEGEYDVINE